MNLLFIPDYSAVSESDERPAPAVLITLIPTRNMVSLYGTIITTSLLTLNGSVTNDYVGILNGIIQL